MELNSALKTILSPKIIACVAGIWTQDKHYCLPIKTAVGVIRASGTRGLVVHIANNFNSSRITTGQCVLIDDLLQELSIPLSDLVFIFNTALCSNLKHVQELIDIIESIRNTDPYNQTYALLKLEILDDNLCPIDQTTIEILEQLTLELRNICIPFLKGDGNSLQHISSLGCPAARIWSSQIGQGLGIIDQQRLARLLNSTNIPLILEGGLATLQHVQMALKMGFSAVLLNSAFKDSPDPIKLASDIRAAIDIM
jgi:thiazole synthase ThiGH ThiG subunit